MKEFHEFRIFSDYIDLLPKNNAKYNGTVYVLNLLRHDPLFPKVGDIYKELRKKDKAFFSSWQVKRVYSRSEIAETQLFRLIIKTAFEPTGEECGTVYDETVACEICGSNRKQISPLKLKKGSIPKKDIARTIAGEIVVSAKFAELVKRRNLTGILLEPVLLEKGVSTFFQLVASTPQIELTEQTITGQHPFDLSNDDIEAQEFTVPGGYKVNFDSMVVNCPKGHLEGSRLITEAFVVGTESILKHDFYMSRQKVGAKQGLLRPEPIYFCSQAFRNMVLGEKLTGFEFERAHLETGVKTM